MTFNIVVNAVNQNVSRKFTYHLHLLICHLSPPPFSLSLLLLLKPRWGST